jgi:hypothetical protein
LPPPAKAPIAAPTPDDPATIATDFSVERWRCTTGSLDADALLVVAVLLSPATARERRTNAGCGSDDGCTAVLAEADELTGWDIVWSACAGGRGIANQATAETASAVIKDAKIAVRTTGDFMLFASGQISLPLRNPVATRKPTVN